MLASTRFNSKTFSEFSEYSEIKGWFYGAQLKIKSKVPLNTILFVVEMNNETNQITGIGVIKNTPTGVYRNIYKDPNYNRYNYKLFYRLTREYLWEQNQLLVTFLELILFKGYTHIKRHSGITIVPESLLTCDRVRGMPLLPTIVSIFKIWKNTNKHK